VYTFPRLKKVECYVVPYLWDRCCFYAANLAKKDNIRPLVIRFRRMSTALTCKCILTFIIGNKRERYYQCDD
ncbi:MAG: hypothetical protein MN733_03070, partial [Nitrososphaera sp.]|nr:hypothetical protein [Nitrososphaera sp.]